MTTDHADVDPAVSEIARLKASIAAIHHRVLFGSRYKIGLDVAVECERAVPELLSIYDHQTTENE